MQLAVDLLLILLFSLMALRGLRRGFFKTVFSVGRLILAFAVTVLMGSTVAGWLDRRFVNPSVFDAVYRRLSAVAEEIGSTAEDGIQAFTERIPPSFRGYLDPEAMSPTAELHDVAEACAHTVADGISGVIAGVLGHVLLFAVSFGLLTVAMLFLGKLTKLPVIRTVDGVLGLALGAVGGLVVVAFASAILGAVLGLTGHGEALENSFMLRLFSGLRDRILS